ncbi:MAG: Uma2 family endonuclease [Saprospiraceae bacterium]
MVTDINQLDINGMYSYADYLKWQFDERVELLKGKIFRMSPAPSTKHQKISFNLVFRLGVFLEKSTCQIFSAPFDVRLSVNKDINISKRYRNKTKSLPDGKIMTVVQPDICVVCNKDILDEKGCVGAPDLVIEILSPGNSRREMKDKFEIYQEAAIPEYWIVDPEHEFIIIYYMQKGQYVGSAPYYGGDMLTSQVIKGFELDVLKIFS